MTAKKPEFNERVVELQEVLKGKVRRTFYCIHDADGPHDRPEDFHDQRVDIKDSWRLVVPEIAIKELAVQEALPDYTDFPAKQREYLDRLIRVLQDGAEPVEIPEQEIRPLVRGESASEPNRQGLGIEKMLQLAQFIR